MFWKCLFLKKDCIRHTYSRYSNTIHGKANTSFFIVKAYFDHQFITKKIVLDFPPTPWQKFIRSMLNNFLTSANHRTMEFVECIGFQHHTVRLWLIPASSCCIFIMKVSQTFQVMSGVSMLLYIFHIQQWALDHVHSSYACLPTIFTCIFKIFFCEKVFLHISHPRNFSHSKMSFKSCSLIVCLSLLSVCLKVFPQSLHAFLKISFVRKSIYIFHIRACLLTVWLSIFYHCWKVLKHIINICRQKTEEVSVNKLHWMHQRLTITSSGGVLEKIFSSEQMGLWTMILFTSGIHGCLKTWNLLQWLSLWGLNHHQTFHWKLSSELILQVFKNK